MTERRERQREVKGKLPTRQEEIEFNRQNAESVARRRQELAQEYGPHSGKGAFLHLGGRNPGERFAYEERRDSLPLNGQLREIYNARIDAPRAPQVNAEDLLVNLLKSRR